MFVLFVTKLWLQGQCFLSGDGFSAPPGSQFQKSSLVTPRSQPSWTAVHLFPFLSPQLRCELLKGRDPVKAQVLEPNCLSLNLVTTIP